MTSTARTPFFIDVGNNKVVQVQIIKSSYSAGLLTALGMTEDTTGEVPAGKALVGKGRLAAMQNGCFGVVLVYKVSATKYQRAKVLCSPTKADTIFADAKDDTYRSKNIVEVTVPKRRVLTF